MEGRIQLGAAWRPAATDKWNGLAKYEFRDERGVAAGTGFGGDATANVTGTGSTAASNGQVDLPNANRMLSILSDRFELPARRAHPGQPALRGQVGHLRLQWPAKLLQRPPRRACIRTYDLTDKWDLGLNASALVDGSFQSAQLALGAEVGYTLSTNLVVGLGYNFLGYYDRDLSDEQYTTKGVYLRMRMKFDETLFHRRRED